MLVFGAAMLLMGVGTEFAAFSTFLFVESLIALMTIIPAFVEVITPFLTVLGGFADTLMMLAFAMSALTMAGMGWPLITLAFSALAAGIMQLSWALYWLGSGNLKHISELMTAMASIDMNTASAISASVEGLEDAIITVQDMDRGDVDSLTEIFDSMHGTRAAEAGARSAEAEASTAKWTAMSEMFSGGGEEGGGEKTIILQLNEREFGRAIVNVLNKKQNLRSVTS
jgi:hypothetical protein